MQENFYKMDNMKIDDDKIRFGFTRINDYIY